MEGMRVKRLAREHAALVLQRKHVAAQVLRTYKNTRLPATEVMPEVLDFCDFPPVKAVLVQPSDITVDESSFADVLPLLHGLIEGWQEIIELQLVRTVRLRALEMRAPAVVYPFFGIFDDEDYDYENVDDDDDYDYDLMMAHEETITNVDTLKLATTVFECKRCRGIDRAESGSDDFSDASALSSRDYRPLFYPKVLGHRCLTRRVAQWFWDVASPEPVAKLNHYSKTRRNWSSSLLEQNSRLGTYVKGIVVAAGMDPATTVADEMDELDFFFGCLNCIEETQISTSRGISYSTRAFNWREAVS